MKKVDQRKWSSNQEEQHAFRLFFPIILIGLLSRRMDRFLDCSKFQKITSYYTHLTELRLIILAVVIFIWRTLKNYFRSVYIMYFLFASNLLIIAGDICVVSQFTEDYKEYSSYSYYKTLYLKNAVNFIFGICWIFILFFSFVNSKKQFPQDNIAVQY